MLYKKSILMLIVLIISSSCSKTNNAETEPNNTFINANVIKLNSDYIGTLESESDIDNYLINIEQEQVLKINLTGIKGINHAMYIYRYDNLKPQLLKIIDDNRKSSPENFSNLYVYSGQYIITILHGSRDLKKGNKDSQYKLSITTSSFFNEEKEPNDIPDMATEIRDNILYKGYYSPAQNQMNSNTAYAMQEFDWYKFNVVLTDGKPALIDVKLSKVDGIDSVLKIMNSSLNELVSIDNGGQGAGETLSDFGIRESGIYYIQVSSKNFVPNHDSPYELQLIYKSHDDGSEIEPNNSFETANPINGTNLKGRINGINDVDFFYFSPVRKNSYYSLGCSGGVNLDVILRLYDGNRNRLFEVNNSGKGGPETIPSVLIKNAVYISVSSGGNNNEDLTYLIDINEDTTGSFYESEPNDTKNETNIISSEIKGFINKKNDKDYYLIRTESNKRVKYLIKGVKGGKIRVSTTDPLGYIIKSKDIDSDEESVISESVDKKGYLIVESLIPVYDSPYKIKIED